MHRSLIGLRVADREKDAERKQRVLAGRKNGGKKRDEIE